MAKVSLDTIEAAPAVKATVVETPEPVVTAAAVKKAAPKTPVAPRTATKKSTPPPKQGELARMSDDEWKALPREQRIERKKVQIDRRQREQIEQLEPDTHLATVIGQLFDMAIDAGGVTALQAKLGQ